MNVNKANVPTIRHDAINNNVFVNLSIIKILKLLIICVKYTLFQYRQCIK